MKIRLDRQTFQCGPSRPIRDIPYGAVVGLNGKIGSFIKCYLRLRYRHPLVDERYCYILNLETNEIDAVTGGTECWETPAQLILGIEEEEKKK